MHTGAQAGSLTLETLGAQAEAEAERGLVSTAESNRQTRLSLTNKLERSLLSNAER